MSSAIHPLAERHFTFRHEGRYLDSAYMHPMSVEAGDSVRRYLMSRQGEARQWDDIVSIARVSARDAFAQMHRCDATSLAFIPSTMAGENAVVSGLGIRPGHGRIVTDGHHFPGSLFLYEQLRSAGVDVEMVVPRAGEPLLDAYERAITPGTTLVAVSAVSATTGYVHDLTALCDVAHSRGALVYADLIQAAGAMPLDLSYSKLDFGACATYKWLMGDFGVGLFYSRAESLERLRRSQFGYRQMASFATRYLPFDDSTVDEDGDPRWPVRASAASGVSALVEVGTQASAAIVALGESLPRLAAVGVDALHAHRKPMIARLHEALPRLGFEPLLSEVDAKRGDGTIAAFAYRDAERWRQVLSSRKISISIYRNRIRVSPSLFNTMDDIEALIDAFECSDPGQ